MANNKRPGTISTTNTPNKKYGGEDTLTAVQKVNRGIRDSFKGSPANKALNAKIKQSVVSTPARRAVNAAIKRTSAPRKGVGKAVSKKIPNLTKLPKVGYSKSRVRAVAPALKTVAVRKTAPNPPVPKLPSTKRLPGTMKPSKPSGTSRGNRRVY